MKLLIILSAIVLSSSAITSDDFNELRVSTIEQIENKIRSLESSKVCVEGATTKKSLEACGLNLDTLNLDRDTILEPVRLDDVL